MALFPSQAWCDALKELLNNSADFAKNAKDYTGDSTWVITPDGTFDKTVRVYTCYDHGHMTDAHIMTEDETREAENTTTAPLGTWRRVIEGKLNPTPALLRGQLKMEGMSMKVVRNVKALQSLFEHVIRIPTEFPN